MSIEGGPRGAGANSVIGLLARWEEMSENYLPGRMQLLVALIDEVTRRVPDEGASVLELGSVPAR